MATSVALSGSSSRVCNLGESEVKGVSERATSPLMEQLLSQIIISSPDRQPQALKGSSTLINTPIDRASCRLAGASRGWGDAPEFVQREVILQLLEASKGLSTIDRAILLGIVRLESGFNPDAANYSSSASGLFQIIRSTARNLGFKSEELFEAENSIEAGVKLFKEEYLQRNRSKLAGLSDNERATMIYSIHFHGAPTLESPQATEGPRLAREKLVPLLPLLKQIVTESDRLADMRHKQSGWH